MSEIAANTTEMGGQVHPIVMPFLSPGDEVYSRIWLNAHELAADELPRVLSGLCQQPGLAATLAIFAVEQINLILSGKMTIPVDPRTGKPLVTSTMKAECIGEFSFERECGDEDGNEAYEKITVPWTTCKEIYKTMAVEVAKA